MKKTGFDSQRSWVVAFAGGLMFLLIAGPVRLGAQLFVDILDRYGASRQASSFPFSLAYCMRSLAGPVAGILGQIYGLQTVTVGGLILSFVGIAGCFFAEDIIVIDIFFGIFYGIGIGSSTSLVPEIINHHFDKHRATANGVVFGLSGFGAIITPPLLDLIVELFGMSGTFLIMSGVVLNSLPAAMLMRRQKPKTGNPIENQISSIENNSNYTNLSTKSFNIVGGRHLKDTSNEKSDTFSVEIADKCHISLDWDGRSKTDNNATITAFDKTKAGVLNKAFTHTEESTEGTRNTDTKFQIGDVSIPKSSNTINEENLTSSTLKVFSTNESQNQLNKTNIECHKIFGKKKKSPKFTSINVLWSPIFLLITYITSSHFYIMYIFWTITVDVVRDKGVQRHLEVYFVIVLSLFDTVGRFFLGSVTDCGFMTTANFSCLCFTAIALSCLLLTRVTGFIVTMVVISLVGLVLGGNTTSQPGLVTGFIPKEKRTMAMASRILLYAPMSFTMSPLIGYFRGDLGSYNGLLYVMAGISLVCSLLLLLLPRISKCKNCESRTK